jgi:hypothetical protein
VQGTSAVAMPPEHPVEVDDLPARIAKDEDGIFTV